MNKCPICGTIPTWHCRELYTSLHILCCPKCKFGSFTDGCKVVELDIMAQKHFNQNYMADLYIINWNRKIEDGRLVLEHLMKMYNES